MHTLTFAGKNVPAGTTCIVDKYDPARDYPYTVRVVDDSAQAKGVQLLRGRVLSEEISLCSGQQEQRHVAFLKPGDYFGEQSLLRGKPRKFKLKRLLETVTGAEGETT